MSLAQVELLRSFIDHVAPCMLTKTSVIRKTRTTSKRGIAARARARHRTRHPEALMWSHLSTSESTLSRLRPCHDRRRAKVTCSTPCFAETAASVGNRGDGEADERIQRRDPAPRIRV